jgi:hypothetical protein
MMAQLISRKVDCDQDKKKNGKSGNNNNLLDKSRLFCFTSFSERDEEKHYNNRENVLKITSKNRKTSL